MRQFGHGQCIRPLGCITPMCYKNNPTRIKSWVDYLLHRPAIVMPSVSHSRYVFEHYLEYMTEHDSKARKALHTKENATKKA